MCDSNVWPTTHVMLEYDAMCYGVASVGINLNSRLISGVPALVVLWCHLGGCLINDSDVGKC